MGIELSKIPGLAEKVAAAGRKEDVLRDLPFLGVDLEICGVAAKQFTPRHFLLLDTAGNPFVCGGDILPEHVAQFLWVVSPGFSIDDREARDAFIASIGELEFEAASDAIAEYVEHAFMDRPESGSRGGGPAPTSFLASLVDRFAVAYGWTRAVVMDTPFGELFQYIRKIRQAENPKVVFINSLQDKVRREGVVAWMAREKGEGQRTTSEDDGPAPTNWEGCTL